MENKCKCGCGKTANAGSSFINGHNLRIVKRTPAWNKAISDGQKTVWNTKREHERNQIGHRRVNYCGYVDVKIARGSGWRTWKMEHVMVMENKIGRKIRKGEIIHHINGDRKDNRIENLFLCKDKQHHNKVHYSQDTALRILLEKGIVKFENGGYKADL